MRTLPALAILTAAALPANAVNYAKAEVFGVVGIGRANDDEGGLGSGVNGGGGLGYRVFRRLGVEGEINAFRTKRTFSSAFPPYQASGVQMMGSGLLYLTTGPTQGYFLFGAGLVHARNTANFGGVVDRSGTGFGVNLGGGVKAFLSEHISLRPEVRIYAGDPGGVIEPPFGIFRVSMAVGYHW